MKKTLKALKPRLPYELRSRTVRWHSLVGSIAAVWFSVQEAVPEIKAVLDPKWAALFLVVNALVGLWLRTRTDKPLEAYKTTATGQKTEGRDAGSAE